MTRRSGLWLILTRHARSWWAVPPLAGLLAFALSARGAPWRGELAWAVDFVGAIHLFMLPVAAAAAAWDGVTWARLDTFGSAPRRPVAPWLWVCASAAPVLALQALTLAVIAILSLSVAHVGVTPWLPMLNQLLAVVAAMAAGLCVGFRWGRPAAVVVTFFAALVVLYLDYASVFPFGLIGDGATGTLLGLRPDPVNQGAKALFCVTTLLACGLLMQRRTGVSRRGISAAVAVGVLGAASMGLLTVRPTSYTVGEPLAATSCTNGRPAFCVLPGWEQFRPEGARRVTLTADVLRARGVTATPEVFVASWPTAPNSSATVSLVEPDRAGRLVPVETTVADVVAPRSCPFWSAAEPPTAPTYLAERLLVLVVLRAEPRLAGATGPGPFADFFATPPRAQDEWTAAAGTALAGCRPDLIPPPPGL